MAAKFKTDLKRENKLCLADFCGDNLIKKEK